MEGSDKGDGWVTRVAAGAKGWASVRTESAVQT